MSLLQNLLSKLNRPPEAVNVPPDLQRIIVHHDNAGRVRRKFAVIGVIGACAIVMGFGLVYYLETMSQPARLRRPTAGTASGPAVTTAPSTQADRAMPLAAATTSPSPAMPYSPQPAQTVFAATGTAPAPPSPAVTSKRHQPSENSSISKQQSNNATIAVAPLPSYSISIPVIDQKATAAPQKLVANENAGTVRTDAFRQSVDKAGRDVCLMAARTAEKKKDYVEALRQYRKALEHDHEDPNIMNSLASEYIRLRDYPAALDMTDKVLTRVHGSISALINQGIARNGLGNTSEALESFTKALTLDPFNRTAMYNLALFHEKNGKLAEASMMFQRLARSGDVQGSMGLARIYEKQSRQAEAIKIYIDVAAKQDTPAVLRTSAVERLRQLGR